VLRDISSERSGSCESLKGVRQKPKTQS
jgi:hypothetical protein